MYFFASHMYVHYTTGWFKGFANSLKFMEKISSRLQTYFISKFIYSCVVEGENKALSASVKRTFSLRCFWRVVL